MKEAKRKTVEAKGWKVGDVSEFLGLTPEELEYIDLKIALGKRLQDRRKEKNLTQVELARSVGSSQSRVVKMEKGDPSVSLDLLIKALLSLGVTRKEVGLLF